MSITRRILFISEDKIKENSIIQLNVDGKVLAQSIYDTQFSHLREITGDTLYGSLLDAVAATKADPAVPLTGDIRTLLLDYIQPFLSRAVLLKLLINLHYRVTDKGVLKYNDSQATSISPTELEYARNQLENEANAFKRILIKYLKEKFNDAGCESRDNDTTSRSIGWYLGGKTASPGKAPLPPDTPAKPIIIGGSGVHVETSESDYTVNAGKDDDSGAGILTKPLNFERNTPDALTNIKQDEDIQISVVNNSNNDQNKILLNKNLILLTSEGIMYTAISTTKPTGEHTIEIINNTDDTVKSRVKLTPEYAKLEIPNDSGEGFTGSVKVETETITIGIVSVENPSVKTITIGDSGINDGILIKDSIDSKGASYDADYTASNTNNALWIPNKGYVDNVGTASLSAANTYADTRDAVTLAGANAYADTQDGITLANANAHADVQAAAALLSANGYADTLVSAIISGFKATLFISSPAPTVDGVYFMGESGTFANFGGLVVDLSQGFIYGTKTGASFTKTTIPLNVSGCATHAEVIKNNPLKTLVRYEHPRGVSEQVGNGTWISPSILGWGISAVMDQSGVINKIEVPFFGFPTTEVEIRVYKQTSATVLGTQLYAKIYAPGELNQNGSIPTILNVDLQVTATDIIGVVMGWKAGAQPNFRYWNVVGSSPSRIKMIQANTNTYPGLFSGSWVFSSSAIYQAAMKVYYLPDTIESVNTQIANTGLTELITMQLEAIASNNFTTPGGFVSNPSFPLTPTFTGGAMQLAFTAATNEGVLFNNVTLVPGQKIEVTIDVRRTAGSGGSLDVGSFGSANNTAETNPYRTLSASEITSTSKTFKFKITPTGTTFGIGLNVSKNLGNTFEIDNIVITKANYKTQAASDIAALKSTTGVISAGVTTTELQAFINANTYVKLGLGTFIITAEMTVPSGHIVEGFGVGTLLKQAPGFVGSIFNQVGLRDYAIRNIAFEGLAPVTPIAVTRADILAKPGVGANNGIYIAGNTTNAEISNCTFKNFNHAGIHDYNTHTTSIYSRRLYISNCSGENNYHGIVSGTRGEYLTLTNNSFCNNMYGGFFAAGNNYIPDNQFNGNACNVVISGTADQNDSHGSLTGGSANHAISFAIYLIDIDNGFIVSNVNIFASPVVLDNCKGAMIKGNIIGGTGIVSINAPIASYNIIQGNVFVVGATVTGDLTKVSMSGNRYLDGSDSTSLNNLV